MVKLELSIFDHREKTSSHVQELLIEFEKKERVKVELEVIPWQGAWERMVNVALYGEGFDVSEVGSTWVGDFVKMDALSQFTPGDLNLVGNENDFAPGCWSSGVTRTPDGSQQIWSIPWSADTRVIYYRSDLLEKAGVQESSAFSTLENFENTLVVLRKSGIDVPFTMPMKRSRQQIHILCSFVWKAGGEFISPSGRKIIFNEPAARKGMKEYFSLGKHLAPQARKMEEGESEDTFIDGKTAVTISGTWVMSRSFSPKIRPFIKTAMLPGIPWVGGSNFVVWKNARYSREAIRLIKFLTNSENSDKILPDLGLPTRLKSLDAPLYKTDPHWKVMRQAVLSGRAFSTEQLWGLIETRLTDLLPIIWEQVLAEPETNVDEILDQYIPGLARRLSMTLSAR